MAAPVFVSAQQQPLTPPHKLLTASPLDDALAHLDANIAEFNRTIPTFFAREALTATMDPAPNGAANLRTSTSSTFVVRRADDHNDPDGPAEDTNNPTQANQLHESRVVHVIDEKGLIKPADGSKKSDSGVRLDSPYVVFGIYSGGSTRISTAAKVCFRYRYHPARNIHGSSTIEIDFQSWPRKDRGPNCPYADNISGHGFIDPTTMRLVRLEDTETDDKGTWTWSVDYASVPLNGKPFWLPTTIRSEDKDISQSMNAMQKISEYTVTHRLTATYSQYRQAKTPAPAP
jgi:hypothetical protein